MASLRGSCLGLRARNGRPGIYRHHTPRPKGGASRSVWVGGVAVCTLFGHQGVGPGRGVGTGRRHAHGAAGSLRGLLLVSTHLRRAL